MNVVSSRSRLPAVTGLRAECACKAIREKRWHREQLLRPFGDRGFFVVKKQAANKGGLWNGEQGINDADKV